MMRKLRKTEPFKLVLAFIALALIFACVLSPVAIADAAQLTDPDVPAALRANDSWQFDGQYLNIAALKAVTASWVLPDKSAADFRPILIGVIDTGITGGHELFSKTLLRATYEENGTQVTKIVGYNSVSGMESTNITDISTVNPYHGTHVAGIIAAMILELGLEDYIKIVPIRAANANGAFTVQSVESAIRWACGENTLSEKLGYELKCDIVNLSLGIQNSARTGTSSWKNITGLQKAIEEYSDEAVFIAAAGNNALDMQDDPYYPAAISEVISVMAYGKSGADLKLLDTSNYGGYDILAPGGNIYSSTSGTATYGIKDGTSMACPYVSFGGALLKLRYSCEGSGATAEITAGRVAKMLRSHKNSELTNVHTEKGYDMRVLDYLALAQSDFFNTELYDASYADPTSITSSSDEAPLTQYMSERAAIRMSAVINPVNSHNPALDSEVEWYVQYKGVYADSEYGEPELVGKGLSYIFPPTNKGGYYKIYAQLTYGYKTFKSGVTEVEIRYIPLDFQNIYIAPLQWARDYKGDGNDVPAYQFSPITLSLAGMQFSDQDVPILWYINGEYVGSGMELTYTPQIMGRHIVTAKIDGFNVIKTFVLDVKGPFFLSYLFTVLMFVACGAFIVLMFLTRHIPKKNPFWIKWRKDKDNVAPDSFKVDGGFADFEQDFQSEEATADDAKDILNTLDNDNAKMRTNFGGGEWQCKYCGGVNNAEEVKCSQCGAFKKIKRL